MATVRFSPSFLDDLRARVALSSVVGRAVQWDRRKSHPGRGDFWACCPFHTEKTPSFHAEDHKGRYHCFGCKASGDVFTFLVETEGLSFPEAVERVAGEAGVALPSPEPGDEAREARRASLYEVMELAARFFEQALSGPEAAAARAYLESRGVSSDLGGAFRIGFAPDQRYALKTHLAEQDVGPEQMVEAGLVIAGEDIAVPYDRFRNRIMFPIRDGRGRVIAFGGRAMSPDAQAKYLNSPDTPLFHKGSVLFNLDLARAPAHRHGTVVAVEGYMDVVALTRAGFANAVAPLGTALTEDQLGLLWRLAPEPVLCFDGDAAGVKAAYRALDLALPLLKPGYSLRFALMPAGQDPDDLLREEGPQAVARALEAAQPMVEMLWRRALERNDRSTPERRASFEADVRAAAAAIAEPKVRTHYQAELGDRIYALWRASRQQPGAPRTSRSWSGGQPAPSQWHRWRGARSPGPPPWAVPLGPSGELKALAGRHDRRRMHEQRESLILVALLNHPELLDAEVERLADTEFATPELDRLRRQLLDIIADFQGVDGASLKDHLRRNGMDVTRLEQTANRLGVWFVLPDAALADARTGFHQMMSLHRKAVTLDRELKAAEQLLAQDPSEANLARLNQIRDELQSAVGVEAGIDGFGAASGRSADTVS